MSAERSAECNFPCGIDAISNRRKSLAGAAGFEPANAGTKNRCLTTWRRPNDGKGALSGLYRR
jgi:hypothetical protein